MPFPTLPLFQVLGVAVSATITAYDNATGNFTFTVSGVAYNANWNTDVLANAINTIGRGVGASGRLNLRPAKATALHLVGWESAGSNYGGTDFQTYTAYNVTVRAVNGRTLTLTVGGANVTVDWTNPGEIWTGAETTITPNVGSVGTARIGDAVGRAQGIGGGDKWPATLGIAGTRVRVVRAGAAGRVAVLDAAGDCVRDGRGRIATWQLPAELSGFDEADAAPQMLVLSHTLKARLGLP